MSHVAIERSHQGTFVTDPLVLEPVAQRLGLAPVVITSQMLIVGSGPGADVRIELSGIEVEHCRLQVVRNRLHARSENSRTWHNDLPLKDGYLKLGDRLAIGPVEFRVRKLEPWDILPQAALTQQPPVRSPLPSVIGVKADATTESGAERTRIDAAESLRMSPAGHTIESSLLKQIAELEAEVARHQSAVQKLEHEQTEAFVKSLRQPLDFSNAQVLEVPVDSGQASNPIHFPNDSVSVDSEPGPLMSVPDLSRRWQEIELQAAALGAREAELQRQAQLLLSKEAQVSQTAGDLALHAEKLKTQLEQVATRELQLQQQSEAIAVRQSSVEKDAERLSAREAELQRQAQELMEQESQVAQTTGKLSSQTESLKSQLQYASTRELDLQRKVEAILARESQVEQDTSRLSTREAELQRLARMIEEKEAQLSEMTSRLAAENEGLQIQIAQVVAQEQALHRERKELVSRETHVTQAASDLSAREADLRQHSQVIVEKEAEVAQQLKSLAADRELLQSELTRVAAQQQELQGQLEAVVARENEVERQSGILTTQEGKLQRQAQALLEKESQIERTASSLSIHSESLKTQLERLTARETELQRQVESTATRETQIERQAGGLSAREAELQRLAQTLLEKEAQVERTATSLASHTSNLNAQLEKVAARERELQRQTESLVVRESQVERQAGGLTAQLENLKLQTEKLLARETELQHQAETLAVRADQLERQSTGLMSREADLDLRADSLSTRDLELQRRGETLDSRESLFSQQVTELDSRAAELVRRTESIRLQESQLEQQTQELSAQQAELRIQFEKLESQKAEIAEQLQQLTATRIELATQTADLAAKETELKHQSESLKQEMAAREADLAQRLTEVAELQETQRLRQEEWSNQWTQLQQLMSEHERATADQTQRESRIAEREQNCQNWEVRLGELQNDLDAEQKKRAAEAVHLQAELEKVTLRQRQLSEQEQALSAGTARLSQLEADCKSRTAVLDQRISGLEARDTQLQVREQELFRRQEALQNRELEVIQREATSDAHVRSAEAGAAAWTRLRDVTESRFTERTQELDAHAAALRTQAEDIARRHLQLEQSLSRLHQEQLEISSERSRLDALGSDLKREQAAQQRLEEDRRRREAAFELVLHGYEHSLAEQVEVSLQDRERARQQIHTAQNDLLAERVRLEAWRQEFVRSQGANNRNLRDLNQQLDDRQAALQWALEGYQTALEGLPATAGTDAESNSALDLSRLEEQQQLLLARQRELEQAEQELSKVEADLEEWEQRLLGLEQDWKIRQAALEQAEQDVAWRDRDLDELLSGLQAMTMAAEAGDQSAEQDLDNWVHQCDELAIEVYRLEVEIEDLNLDRLALRDLLASAARGEVTSSSHDLQRQWARLEQRAEVLASQELQLETLRHSLVQEHEARQLAVTTAEREQEAARETLQKQTDEEKSQLQKLAAVLSARETELAASWTELQTQQAALEKLNELLQEQHAEIVRQQAGLESALQSAIPGTASAPAPMISQPPVSPATAMTGENLDETVDFVGGKPVPRQGIAESDSGLNVQTVEDLESSEPTRGAVILTDPQPVELGLSLDELLGVKPPKPADYGKAREADTDEQVQGLRDRILGLNQASIFEDGIPAGEAQEASTASAAQFPPVVPPLPAIASPSDELQPAASTLENAEELTTDTVGETSSAGEYVDPADAVLNSLLEQAAALLARSRLEGESVVGISEEEHLPTEGEVLSANDESQAILGEVPGQPEDEAETGPDWARTTSGTSWQSGTETAQGGQVDADQDPGALDIRARLAEMFGMNLGAGAATGQEQQIDDLSDASAPDQSYADQTADLYAETPFDGNDSSVSEQSYDPLAQSDGGEQQPDPDVDEDDSVETYMRRLLERNCRKEDRRKPGEDGDSYYQRADKTPPRETTAVKSYLPEVSDDPVEVTPEVPVRPIVPRPPVDLKKVREGIDCLREVANTSARAAIAKSKWRKMRTRIMFESLLTGFAVLMGLAMIMERFVLRGVPVIYGWASLIIGLSLLYCLLQDLRWIYQREQRNRIADEVLNESNMTRTLANRAAEAAAENAKETESA